MRATPEHDCNLGLKPLAAKNAILVDVQANRTDIVCVDRGFEELAICRVDVPADAQTQVFRMRLQPTVAFQSRVAAKARPTIVG